MTITFFPQLIRGAETAARQRGYSLIAVNSDDDGERLLVSGRDRGKCCRQGAKCPRGRHDSIGGRGTSRSRVSLSQSGSRRPVPPPRTRLVGLSPGEQPVRRRAGRNRHEVVILDLDERRNLLVGPQVGVGPKQARGEVALG